MNFYNWLAIIGVITVAIIAMRIIGMLDMIDLPSGHYTSIDGLRGLLAVSVFIHHAEVWHFFLRNNKWGLEARRVYIHLGPTSVAVFFMITAFLFTSKLLSARGQYLDWIHLYIGRFCRIMPLYTAVVLGILVIVGFLSDFKIRESTLALGWQWCQWMIFIQADVNGIEATKRIVAGVVWSLAFEWLFYFSIAPLGKFAGKIITPFAILMGSTLLWLCFALIINNYYPDSKWLRASPFVAGIACAFFARKKGFMRFAKKPIIGVVTIILILIVGLCYDGYGNIVSYTSLSLAFAFIAAGQSIFGLLNRKTLRALGQISYSIYLCHGLFLFVVFRFIIGVDQARHFSVVTHWIVIGICTVFLMLICTCTYLWIERPFLKKTTSISNQVKHYFYRRKLRLP